MTPAKTPAAPTSSVSKSIVAKVTTTVVMAPTTRTTGTYKVTIAVPKGHPAATGTVTVTVKLGSSTHTATGTLSGGAATIALGKLTKGTWKTTVAWPGDAHYVAANAAGANVKVAK